MTQSLLDHRETLFEACRKLAAVCDGAQTEDGVGFNGTDSALGRRLADTPWQMWDPDWVSSVAQMLVKYKRQLTGFGVDVATIAQLAADDDSDGDPLRAASIRTAQLDESGRWIVLSFGYDPEVVNAVKALPGRQWMAEAKSWRIPLSRRVLLADLVKRFGFVVDPAIASAKAPETARGTVTLEGDELALRFDREFGVIAAVKDLANRRWDPERTAWFVPTYLIRPVRELAEKFGWLVAPEVVALADVDPEDVPVEITEDRGMLLVRFPYDRRLVSMMHSVPDATFDARNKTWRVPVENAMDLVAQLERNRIETGDLANELIAQAQAMIARVEASRALDAEFDVDGLAITLYPFQRAGVAYASEVRRCLIADEMGLGKTPQALATLQATGSWPAAIMVPAVVKVNWRREIAKALPHLRTVVLHGIPKPAMSAALVAKLNGGETQPLIRDELLPGQWADLRLDGYGDLERCAVLLPQADAVIVNYDICSVETLTESEIADGKQLDPGWTPVLKALGLRGLVADECHGLKNPKALRTRTAIELSRTVSENGVVLGLTGTPVLNRRSEVASQLDFIGRLSEFGGASKVATMSDLARRLRARCMVRRMKSEVLPELPPRQHVPQIVPNESLDSRIMRDYRKAEIDLLSFMAERAAAMADEMGLDAKSAAMEARMKAHGHEFLLRIGVLLQLAMKAKMAEAERWIADFLKNDDSKKLLVFSCHLLPLHELEKRFGAPVIRGGVSPEERSAIVDRFQNDPQCRLVLLQIDAGGVGLTMTAASDVLFIEQAWSPAIHDQAIDRCYGRMNDVHGAVGWYLLAEDTLDVWLADLLDGKRVECHDATNGDIPTSADAESSSSVYGDLVVMLTRKALAG